MSDSEFRDNMTRSITGLRKEMNDLCSSVATIKLTQDKHNKLLQCVTDVANQLKEAPASGCSSPTTLLPCRDHASSMMSEHEIQEDFNDRRPQYQEDGDCVKAAADAFVFFKQTHKLMRPKLVEAVLYASSGEKAVMGKSGISPAERADVIPTMKRFKLLADTGCIWVPAEDANSHDIMNVEGMRHRVTLVTTLVGARVVVDWGIAQFSYLPKDISLFIMDTDFP
jgi:hypothetical protein